MDKVLKSISELIAYIVAMFLLGFLYKWCWNETMPYLFGLPTITYWKMVGVVLLANALFGRVLKKS